MMYARFHMLDDRQERVPVTRFAPFIMPWQGRAWLAMPSTQRLFIYLSIIAALVIAAPVIDYLRHGTVRDARSTFIIAVVPGALCVLVLFAMLQSQDRPYRARQIARRGRCPACGYDLAGLRASDDGCTTCPECGSAWNLENAHTRQSASRPEPQTILDDRGQIHRMPRWAPTCQRDLWKFGDKWWRDPTLRYVTAAELLFCVALIVLWVGDDYLAEWIAWTLIVLLGAGAWVTINAAEKHTKRYIERTYYPEGHCHNCLEPLADIPADDDGCTICPNCSAAWRLSTPRRTG